MRVASLTISSHYYQEVAELLAKRAEEVAESESVKSPFADAVEAAGYINGYKGGKADDVAVVVSFVQKRS